MRDFSVHCKVCNKPCALKGAYVYMRCMCDEDTRIFPLIDIKYLGENNAAYLLETTESNSYASMESPSQIKT